jgi:hypothetical protein
MAIEKTNESPLTQEQIRSLSEYIVDVYGTGLPEEELVESISVVLEDVPGVELVSSQSFQCVINQIRNQYYGQCQRQKN